MRNAVGSHTSRNNGSTSGTRSGASSAADSRERRNGLAAIAWLAMSLLFSWYLGNFANYNATYGALGAVVGLMMWMWLSTIVVLVGAELNSEIEHQTAHDTTVGPARPLGGRGAVMADTVGAGLP